MSSFRVGGGERIMIDLANEFSKRGYPVDLIVLAGVGEYESQISPSVTQVRINASRMLFSVPKIILYLIKEKPQVLIAGDEHTSIYAILSRYLAFSRTKVVVRVGTMYSRLLDSHKGFNKRYAMLMLMKLLCKHAYLVIAVSKGIAFDLMEVLGVPEDKIFTIYNPKPLVLIKEKSKESIDHPWLSQKTVPVIIAVGRFRLPKNFQSLIHAFSVVRKEFPARLIFVGRGRDRDELEALSNKLGCSSDVFFSGYTDNPYAWMSKADIFVLSSLWEGMPNTLLEAMACGLPVISSDCLSGPREVLAPNTDFKSILNEGFEQAQYGILYAVNDTQALADALKKFLADDILRKKYVEAGGERIKDFDSKKIIDEYLEVLISHTGI